VLACSKRDVHIYESISQALEANVLWQADAVLFGPSDGTSEGLNHARDLRAMHKSQAIETALLRQLPRIITCSPHTDDELYQTDAVYSGVSGCIAVPMLNVSAAIRAVEIVLSGGTTFSAERVRQMQHIQALTQIQVEILKLAAEHYSNSDIAERLNKADSTIKNQIQTIFQKLDVHSRREAIYRAQHLGWLRH
jgi:DNA-binding NarL/FixJ family response regulator